MPIDSALSRQAAKVALLALIFIQALSVPGPSQADERLYTSAQMIADLDVLHAALISGDPGIYRFTKRPKLEAEFRTIRAHLSLPMNAAAFYKELAFAVAAVKNGHTQLEWPDGVKEQILAREFLLPLGVRVLRDDRVYVFRDFSSQQHDLAGFELLSVNGRSSQWIIANISKTLSEDGDIPTSRRIDSSGPNFLESLPLLFGIRSPFTITVRNGRLRKSLRLTGRHEVELTRSWKRLYPSDFEVSKQSGAEFRMLPGSQTAVLRVSHWDSPDDPKAMNLTERFGDWFAQMKSSRPKTLIIDIRHNGGGEETLGTLLLSYLSPGPFIYYKAALANGTSFDFFKYVAGTEMKDALHHYIAPIKGVIAGESSLPGAPTARYELVNRPNLGTQKPSKPHFDGQVLVLIDGQSFSTSAEFAAVAQSSGRATFIGEETSGSYYGNDSGITPAVVLPNTKFKVDVPLIAYYTAVTGHRYQTRGVFPDCAVANTITDDLKGRDNAMNAALELAAGGGMSRIVSRRTCANHFLQRPQLESR